MIRLESPPEGLSTKDPVTIIATWFGTGLLRPAPGTWGAFTAIPVAWVLNQVGGTSLFFAAIIGAIALGIWAATEYEKASQGTDPASVVIDEVVGQWIALLFIPFFSLKWMLVAFVLFRIFDIIKPWPVDWAEKNFAGGLGIMADDMVAGLISGALIIILYAI